MSAGVGANDLLSPGFLAQLERLQMATRRRLTGQLSGDHRSPRRGSSLEFADHRPYHPGDDFRRIDHLVYARLGQLLIKLYEAEEDLAIRLLVDTSASMEGAKLATAARAAAALGFSALVRRDVVTVHTVPLDRLAPRFVGRNAAGPLFGHLASLEAEGETPFAAAVVDLLARPGPPGLTVVVSDLLTPEWDDGLRRLPARRGDLVVIHTLDRSDLEPDMVGDLELVDREHGGRVEVSISPDVAADYARIAHAWADDVAGRTRGLGGAYVRLMTDDDLEATLLTTWRDAGVLR
jgi:uncharacterized protein (DUF58 family)